MCQPTPLREEIGLCIDDAQRAQLVQVECFVNESIVLCFMHTIYVCCCLHLVEKQAQQMHVMLIEK